MTKPDNSFGKRNLERVCLIITAIVLGLLFRTLHEKIKKDAANIVTGLTQGNIVNLNDPNSGAQLASLLKKGRYFQDEKDIQFIAASFRVANADGTSFDNVGELNKKKFFVEATKAFNEGGKSFKNRVMISRNLLGFSEPDSISFIKESISPLQAGAQTALSLGNKNIRGIIKSADGTPAPGALVRLKMLPAPENSETSGSDEDTEQKIEFKNNIRKIFIQDSAEKPQLFSLSAYARTGATGEFLFTGLIEGRTYEVLPLQPGFEFGRRWSIQNLAQDAEFNFTRTTHFIRLFAPKDFNNLKKEKSLIVRTPEEVSDWFFIIIATFFCSFFILHLVFSVWLPKTDQLILPVIMLLTGVSIITLLSLQDPLRDRFLARSTITYFSLGMIFVLLLQFVNLKRFTPDSDVFRLFIFKNNRQAANGWPWIAAAIGLLILTIIFGTGPEGSGVKVNLFGFQPSEIVKYMTVIFLAAFFARNEKFISEYPGWSQRMKFFSTAVIAVVSSILLFLLLGDLGPAMVCCFTFILLFSFSRGDFVPMLLTILFYIFAVWMFKNVVLATGIAVIVLTAILFFSRKTLSESSLMALILMSSFLLLDKVKILATLIPGPMKRLIDRKAIWTNPWNNQTFGGDQVANGIWAISGGGASGQGVGEGFAKSIPEAHTDMILPAMGEEFGWAGISCIFILFLIYLHRAILIGRQAGAPFMFYLCAGIGISTFVQFLLIAGGSTGALPLSGVALPFFSYGGTSLLCSLFAAGFLLAASRLQGSPAQMKYIARQDRNLVPSLLAACAGVVLLMINVSTYSFNNKKWVVEPSLVADRNGLRMFSYNPRINILMNRLQAGNIYDRNGKLLATSRADLAKRERDSLRSTGFSSVQLEAAEYKRADRYYPYAEHTFFWTGDANTGIFSGGSNGYFAEYAHISELRGFPTPETKYEVPANETTEENLPASKQIEINISKKDFSALSDLLLAGINSAEVEAFKKQDRDVQLTIDAGLQTKIQMSLAADDSANHKRISVVILEDSSGDVIASAGWPLPAVDDWDKLTLGESELNKLPGWNTNTDLGFTLATQPGSTAKLVTALAAFNKLGDVEARRPIRVYPQDLIRTKGPEPDEAGSITIERAIVRSNNSFFIRLANEKRLQEEMGALYLQTGMFLRGVGGYFYGTDHNREKQESWKVIWRDTEFKSLKRYNPSNIRRTRAIGVSGMSWGQGELVATPAAVARAAAGIANKGIMMQSRYVLSSRGSAQPYLPGIPIVKDSLYANRLMTYMKKQSAGKLSKLGILVAGKTGTPERILKGERINDGWYVFFAPKPNGAGHIVTCIRIEGTRGSSDAVRVAGKHIVPLLLEKKYIKGFEKEGKEK